ncbi:MAG: hypothetical protein M3464_10200 [Chloroflexota bacterium]|nr:hypothetical protein [Chloroflexota bacterium]
MRAGWPLVLLLLTQVGLAVTGLAIWAWLPAVPAPSPIRPATVEAWPASLESASPIAAAEAAAWLPEARLLHASLQIDWPWQAPPAGETEPLAATGWVGYVFAAPWTGPAEPAGGATLSVLVERLSSEVVFQSTTAWATMPALPPVPTEPAVTSLQAVMAAEAAAGAEFRHACPVHRHLTRVSLVSSPTEPPHWLVTYEDTRQRDRHGLIVTIDAATGEPLALGGTAPECEPVE